MKKISFVLISVFYLLLSTNAMSLPKCTGTYGSLLSFAWTNCYGKAELKDGATYEGEFYNEKAHGQGIYIFSNGDRVEGEFNNGVAHGFAIMTLANGNVYEGNFSNGNMNGKGTYKFSNGDIYEGDISNGNLTGVGTYKFSNGDIYTGDISNGLIQGKGRYTFKNGEVYEGIFEGGQFVEEAKIDQEENNKKVSVKSNEVIFKNCKLSPNYSSDTIISIDMDKKIIKVSSQKENSIEYYDIKTIYGDLLVSSGAKFVTGISDNELKQLNSVIFSEFKIDLDQNIVSQTWDVLDGNSKMHKYFRDMIKSGKKERYVSSKCTKV